MARLIKEKHFCCVCKRIEEYEVVAECDKAVERDMDTRPYGEARALGKYGIQLCPYCGYANTAVDEAIEGIDVEKIIAGGEYSKLLSGRIDENAKKFILAAFLHEMAGNYDLSAYFYLKAAWMFDDAKEEGNAVKLRKRSLVDFAMLEQNAETLLLEADISRRCGGFKEAGQLISKIRKSGDVTNELKQCIKAEKAALFWKNRDALKRPGSQRDR